ncbi:MAG: hypothetical protein SAJ12_04730 [Jaaginema sp. PMC 1079.18]|nr:hypothetical protein [Jaaginema sp. PMC 1080.18]MEC4850297.1 hypothetical protein [Jaaginema sp. PMC 1079.18]MEC4865867.1 hypothetical protein [Jaaginema sp. PMC 1078.18]
MFKRLFFSSLLLGSFLACSSSINRAAESDNLAANSVKTSEMAMAEADLLQAEFDEIDPKKFQNRYNLTVLEPRAVGLDLFTLFTQESEGRQAESLEIKYFQGNTAFVLVTIIGLADDSVRSKRYRVEFQRQNQNWEMVSVGAQYQCHQGRGQQDWGADWCS